MTVSPTSDFGLETSAGELEHLRDLIDDSMVPEGVSWRTLDKDLLARLLRDFDRLLSLQRWQPMETARLRSVVERLAALDDDRDRFEAMCRAISEAMEERGSPRSEPSIADAWQWFFALCVEAKNALGHNPPTQEGGGSDRSARLGEHSGDTTQPRPSDDQAGGAKEPGWAETPQPQTREERLAYINRVRNAPGIGSVAKDTLALAYRQICYDANVHSSGIQEGLERAAKLLDAKATMLRDNAAALGSDHLLVLAGQVEADAAAIRASGEGR